jgi:thiopeptide-type bacteriocin biosynthesis protein
VGARPSPQLTAQAVLAVLAGAPLHQAAADLSMAPDDLASAIEVYQAAGQAALEAQTRASAWHQVQVQFTDWDAAERTAAAQLWPHLRQAETAGTISSWWFIRKVPCWRLRCRPGNTASPAELKAFIDGVLGAMLARGLIARFQEAIYEPEIYAFGGPHGMTIAHRLFHADSRNILGYLNQHDSAARRDRTVGRRELSILLCSVLLRGAGQDWYEQGDIWNRIATNRPVAPGTPLERLRDTTPALHRLMTVDAGPGSTLAAGNGALAVTSDWMGAFEQVGKALGAAARDGRLSRGLRDILAHHIIFHWNRFGLTSRTQSILAEAAREAVFGK